MNGYARLAHIKEDLGVTVTTYDAILARLTEDVSEAVAKTAGVDFHSQARTRYFAGDGTDVLDLRDALISVTTLKVDEDGDGTFELTLIASTDYWLEPMNAVNEPYRSIRINPYNPQLYRWPRRQRAVEVAGKFGYSEETEATTLTVQGGGINSSATALTVSADADTLVSVGDTLLIESEQVDVTAVADTALTIVRGINGTTAAAHSASVAITRRRFHRPIERAVAMQVSRLYKRRESAFANVLNNTDLGTVSIFRGLDPDIEEMVRTVRPAYALGIF